MCYVVKYFHDETELFSNGTEIKHKNVVTFISNRKHANKNKFTIGSRYPTGLKSNSINREVEEANHVNGSFKRARRLMLFYILRDMKLNNKDNKKTYNINMIDKDLLILNINFGIKSFKRIFKIDRIPCIEG